MRENVFHNVVPGWLIGDRWLEDVSNEFIRCFHLLRQPLQGIRLPGAVLTEEDHQFARAEGVRTRRLSSLVEFPDGRVVSGPLDVVHIGRRDDPKWIASKAAGVEKFLD
jgi:hypothetical protein